jgi:signal transduction histidine kinase
VAPPAILAVLGWRGLAHEERARHEAERAAARQEALAAVDETAARLERIRRAEDARPYFHWQPRIMPADVLVVNGPAFVESPLASGKGASPPAGRERPLAWFQWTFASGVVAGPDVLTAGAPDAPARAAVALAAPDLLPRLRAAPASIELAAAKASAYPVRIVAANEEVGQLLEELPIAQQSETNQTAYLRNFEQRVGPNGAPPAAEPTVAVRATPFRHALVRDDGGGRVVAWRLVWIPGREAQSKRDAPVDRWLLQGYLPDATIDVPAGGRVRTDAPAAADDGAARVRLAERMPIESADPSLEGPAALGVPDVAALRAADRSATWRYALVSGGLLAVVCVGFFVLARSVRKELDAARRKEDFVAAVSHELKTPLTGIRMYAEMLGEGWVPEGGSPREYARRIVDETTRLATLVDRVLAFASLERGVATAAAVPGDLGEAVRAATAACEPASAEAGVPVAVEVEDGLPLVPFDPAFVRPIVANLVDNAVKYSARSETKDVRVAVRRDGDGVVLSVADRGAGIAREDLPRLFAPFQRGGREETRTARGVGLGLALVKRYADAHRARVSLESEPGRGTTVSVRFPV